MKSNSPELIYIIILLVRPYVRKERMRSEEAQWISCVCSNQCLTTLSVCPYDDSEYNQPYSTKNEGKYIYKTKLQTQKKYWLFMVSIPISTNIVITIANLIYYLYSDNGNKQYRRMQTNKTSTRKSTTERETASLTTELRNMDRSSNSEQHRQIRERRASEEREQHRSTNSEKRRQSRSQQPCELSMHQIFY